MKKIIVSVPGANDNTMAEIKSMLNNGESGIVLTNAPIEVYVVEDGKTFRVVNTREEVFNNNDDGINIPGIS